MRHLLATSALVLALAACGNRQAELILSEAFVCESIGNGLVALANSGKVKDLDTAGVARLNEVRDVSRPICSDPKNPPKDLATATPKLMQALSNVNALKAAVGVR